MNQLYLNSKKFTFCCLAMMAIFLSNAQQNNNWHDNHKGTITIKSSTPELYNGISTNIHWYTPQIVRITNGTSQQEAGDTSLMVIPIESWTAYTLKEKGDSLFTSSNALMIAISKSTGKVAFYRPSGERILTENAENDLFTTTVANGEKILKIHKSFLSTDDDAYYGLGQHQDDQFNYKNRQVSFFQNNTSVAIPFMVSSKGYGILWDNCSLTKIGDVRSWLPISALTLISDKGEKGWLTQTFYNNKEDLSKPLTIRANSNINIAYLGDSKIQFPEYFTPEKGAIIYKGKIGGDINGIYKFHTTYAGYVTIKIDGKTVFDRWRQAWNPGAGVIELSLKQGALSDIEIDWIPDGGESYFTLKILPPIPTTAQNSIDFLSEAGHKSDYYFVVGDNIDQVIHGYRTLTGKAPMFPKWAFGFWQSRERYKTQKEITDVVSEFRKRHIPIDNIVQDWSYWKENQWGSQNFDSARFPDPSKMVKDLHDNHTQVMISVWPKFYTGIDSYEEFQKNGWLYGRNVADSQRDWIGKGYVSTFYDAFNKEARKGFWNLINKRLYRFGIDAWWMDASEPDILSNVSPQKRLEQMTPTALGSPSLWLNAYPLENARGIYEGQRGENNNRVFLLTRSGYAGSQRYGAAIWSGDIASRWYDMKAQISAGLNFSLSGLPYWTMDAGGFSVEKRFENPNATNLEEWRELQTRWFQFSAFTPIFRAHGQYPFREIFNISTPNTPSYKSMLYYNRLRYKLMPYIYSLAGATYQKDYTIMRALVMDFAYDKKVTDMGDAYMFGPSFLVNPIYNYKQRKKEVYLPAKTDWYDFNSGKLFSGGTVLNVDAPYETLPLFVKAGSIIPTGPDMEYIAQKKADPLTIYVFEGADGQFDLYEDNGLDYSYEKGAYINISFTYNDQNHSLTISDKMGSYPEELQQRKMEIVWIRKSNQSPIFESKNKKTIIYKGKKQTIQL